jgi:hypothetical protein
MNIVMAIVTLIAYFVSGHVIDLKNERAKLVGKLKHKWPVIVLNAVAFVGLVSLSGNIPLVVWAVVLSAGFIIPIIDIPYTCRYNVVFSRSWEKFRQLKRYTFAAGVVVYFLF